MNKSVQVHMLPTEKGEFLPQGIVLATRTYDDGRDGIEEGKLYYNKNPKIPVNTYPYDSFIPQHLYLTSKEKVDARDWAIDEDNNLFQVNKDHELEHCSNYKIVATTNPDLWIDYTVPFKWNIGIRDYESRTELKKGISKIGLDFVEAYVKAYNEGNFIKEVSLEYEDGIKKSGIEGDAFIFSGEKFFKHRNNGTIVWHT